MPGDLLVINADGPETRVALIEKGQLVELYIERRRERGIVGNIYKGRVKRVLPGMQAAFVDIGVEKAAFLYVADVRGAPEDFKSLFLDSDDDEPRDDQGPRKHSASARIEDLLKEGQEILVQVAKEPIGTKGARSPRTSRCRAATWCSCRRSTTSASRAASERQGAPAAARDRRVACGPRAPASSCAPSPRA